MQKSFLYQYFIRKMYKMRPHINLINIHSFSNLFDKEMINAPTVCGVTVCTWLRVVRMNDYFNDFFT